MRGILACAILGSFVLAAPFNHTTGVVNDKQEVSVYDGNRSLVPHGNDTEGAARNVSLYNAFHDWCFRGGQLTVVAYVYYSLWSLKPGSPPAPPAPPALPAPVAPPEVVQRDAISCIQTLEKRVDGCADKKWEVSYGECKCMAVFGSDIDNQGTKTSGLFQELINELYVYGVGVREGVVMDYGAGTPQLIGIGVGCGQDWTGLNELYSHWQSGYEASGAAQKKTMNVKIVVNTRDEL